MNHIFPIGATVWIANCGIREVTHSCPVCFGKRVVRLELGNGELISTPCEYCGKGYEGPTGIEKQCEWVAKVEAHTITGVRTEQSGETTKASYTFGSQYIADDCDVFATREEAEARCVVRVAENAESERRRRESMKEYAHKNFAWHVGYHRKEAANHKRQAEYHEARAVACKNLAKTPVEEITA